MFFLILRIHFEIIAAVFLKLNWYLQAETWIGLLFYALVFLFVEMSVILDFAVYKDCGCPQVWEWHIGIFCLLIGWMNFVAHLSRCPTLGLYVLVFLEILRTLLKVAVFALVLVIAFSIILYMIFSGPNAEVHVGHSNN